MYTSTIITCGTSEQHTIPQLDSNNFYDTTAVISNATHIGIPNADGLINIIPDLYPMIHTHRVAALYIHDVPALNINNYRVAFPRVKTPTQLSNPKNAKNSNHTKQIFTLDTTPNYKSVFVNMRYNVLICADPAVFNVAATMCMGLTLGGSAILAWQDTHAAKHMLHGLSRHFRLIQRVTRGDAVFILLHHRQSGSILPFRDYLIQIKKHPNTKWFKI